MADSRPQIGFVLFPNVNNLDFAGPWEILARVPHADCHVVTQDRLPLITGHGLHLLPTKTFEDCPPLDVLCVPGGDGHLQAMESQPLLNFLRHQAAQCTYVTAVCTGSLILAAAGLLRGYRATTHWLSLDRLAGYGAIPVNERVVVDGNLITGGGVTAGIDFGLTLAALLGDEDLARRIQLQVEYAPAPPFGDGHPNSASPSILASVRERTKDYVARMATVDARIRATDEWRI